MNPAPSFLAGVKTPGMITVMKKFDSSDSAPGLIAEIKSSNHRNHPMFFKPLQSLCR
jgi:hypothetical protein